MAQRRAGPFVIRNDTRRAVLATRARRANNIITRAFGLMGRSELPADEALIIRPCSSVTTAFMRFPIDVLFVDKHDVVRDILPAMVPWRVSRFVRGSSFVIELPTGVAAQTDTQVGDVLSIEPAG